MANRITINGVTIDVPDGANVTVENGVLRVNGVHSSSYPDLPSNNQVVFKIEGHLGGLRVDRGSVEVSGTVSGTVQAGGSVSIGGDCDGMVQAGGSVTCGGSIRGGVTAGGSIRCSKIG